MAASKTPNINPETSSTDGLDEESSSRGETKWKKFHPFRVVRKIFRRRIKRDGVSDASKKSWSTSELQSVQDDGSGKREVTSPLKIGLSVSHDSIFSPENNPGVVSSETLGSPHGSSLSMQHSSLKNMFKDELFTRVIARRDSDDDDIGLPHSPCTSPTTVDVLTQGLKEKASKSQTTCSVGSLISMGSSENEEDSAGQSSGHSSRMSLIDRRSLDLDADADYSQPVPLNHNAAHHKIAIRPKRTYGLPRRRMNQIAAAKGNKLPSTPEVTENSGKTFRKFDATEVKNFTEHFSTSLTETFLKQSEELQISQSIVCSFTDLPVSLKDSTIEGVKVASECSSQNIKDALESQYKLLSEEIVKELASENFTSDQFENKLHSVLKDHINSDSNNVSHSDINTDFTSKFRIDEESSRTSKFVKCESTLLEDYDPSEEISPKVSKLVRSIEKSDSFKNFERFEKSGEETKTSFVRNVNDQSNSCLNATKNSDLFKKSKIELKSMGREILSNDADNNQSKTSVETKTKFFNREYKTPSEQVSKSEFKPSNFRNNLDVDSEYALKSSKGDHNSSPMDGKQQMSANKQNSSTASISLDNSVDIRSESLNLLSAEESITSVSPKNNVNVSVVTEAHNFAAVQETVELIQSSTKHNLSQESPVSWISTVDVPSPHVTLNSDVTINSMTSTICDKRIKEDKITVSVNSKHETFSHEKDDFSKLNSAMQKPFVLPKNEIKQKIISKGRLKESGKLIPKNQQHDTNTVVSNSKAVSAQKRVSVEIIPFSQRMKEKKYESLLNKELSDDKNQKSTRSIERKLSDAKDLGKNKVSDKTNNRHSFSEASIASKKEETKIDMKTNKAENIQYPVQIRVHKTADRSEIKDQQTALPAKGLKCVSNKSNSNDVEFKAQSTELFQTEGKCVPEERNIQDKSAKWEVKIQNLSSQLLNSQIKTTDENNFLEFSENAVRKIDTPDLLTKELVVEQPQKSKPSLGKSSEKSSRDVPSVVSDEPEPELLRIFARRSIKQKDCDKEKSAEKSDLQPDKIIKGRSFATNSEERKEPIVANTTGVVKTLEIQKPTSKSDLKKKSKSFCEKEKTRSVSPLREINLIRRESLTKVIPDISLSNEAVHPRQRLASVPDIPVNLPPETKLFRKESFSESSPFPNRDAPSPKANASICPLAINSPTPHVDLVKENQDVLSDKDPHAPSWLQLAQQRRELREQRERLLLGGPTNSFMDGSNKPSRSSKVWDMVNNFQKLQMT